MSFDKLSLKKIKTFGFHGVFENERKNGQIFFVSADLFFAFPRESDDLNSTVNYAEVALFIKNFVEKKPGFFLIETLAERLSEAIFAAFPRIEKLTLKIHKPFAPIENLEISDISAEISRSREK